MVYAGNYAVLRNKQIFGIRLDTVVQAFFPSPQNKRCVKLKLITRRHYFVGQYDMSILPTHSLKTPWPQTLSQGPACTQDGREGTLSAEQL